MFGRKVKVIEHGYFFRKGMLETECKCGCVYRTPKKNVTIRSENGYFGKDLIFESRCPECDHENVQSKREMEKAVCKDE